MAIESKLLNQSLMILVSIHFCTGVAMSWRCEKIAGTFRSQATENPARSAFYGTPGIQTWSSTKSLRLLHHKSWPEHGEHSLDYIMSQYFWVEALWYSGLKLSTGK